MKPYTFITTVEVIDPTSGGLVELELWKDNESGGIMGVDSSFLDSIDHFYNPFNGQRETTSDVLPCKEAYGVD
jgi:hypothetical protein